MSEPQNNAALRARQITWEAFSAGLSVEWRCEFASPTRPAQSQPSTQPTARGDSHSRTTNTKSKQNASQNKSVQQHGRTAAGKDTAWLQWRSKQTPRRRHVLITQEICIVTLTLSKVAGRMRSAMRETQCSRTPWSRHRPPTPPALASKWATKLFTTVRSKRVFGDEQNQLLPQTRHTLQTFTRYLPFSGRPADPLKTILKR